ncbi:TlpA disulfide reductase family protein [Parapedobacter sp. DT-150]|uniref:TlpA disulfide reductase family protein n=1 Tax=Parapedobacter sp. DT-150 TaxID=3396162 RepID=UPI003F1C5CB2
MNRLLIVSLSFAVLSISRARTQERIPLITLDGLEKRLDNGGDTTFIINLWATWCAPCVAEMPHFEQLQRNHQSKPLRVLFVSLDAKQDHDAVLHFVGTKGLKNEVLLLDEKNEQAFIPQISPEWSGAIPATLFVNTEKDIRIFKEQEFDYEALEHSYLSIIH